MSGWNSAAKLKRWLDCADRHSWPKRAMASLPEMSYPWDSYTHLWRAVFFAFEMGQIAPNGSCFQNSVVQDDTPRQLTIPSPTLLNDISGMLGSTTGIFIYVIIYKFLIGLEHWASEIKGDGNRRGSSPYTSQGTGGWWGKSCSAKPRREGSFLRFQKRRESSDIRPIMDTIPTEVNGLWIRPCLRVTPVSHYSFHTWVERLD